MLDHVRKQYSPSDLPYHLIVPSLPGYAFSSAPPIDRDFGLEDIGRILNRLALNLGFGSGYIIQGGDIGSKVGRVMAATYDEVKGKRSETNYCTLLIILAIHVNFMIMKDPKLSTEEQSSIPAIEAEGLLRAKEFERVNSAYATEHATKPAIIGLVLSSNSVAILAWIGEKFLDWTDEDPSLDTILEAVSVYWFTNCAATCIYPYRQVRSVKQCDAQI